MIDKKTEKVALWALHDLLGKGRQFAFEDLTKEDMISYFDELHYLLYLMVSDEEQTAFFEKYFEDVCIRFAVKDVWARYLKRKALLSCDCIA